MYEHFVLGYMLLFNKLAKHEIPFNIVSFLNSCISQKKQSLTKKFNKLFGWAFVRSSILVYVGYHSKVSPPHIPLKSVQRLSRNSQTDRVTFIFIIVVYIYIVVASLFLFESVLWFLESILICWAKTHSK